MMRPVDTLVRDQERAIRRMRWLSAGMAALIAWLLLVIFSDLRHGRFGWAALLGTEATLMAGVLWYAIRTTAKCRHQLDDFRQAHQLWHHYFSEHRN
jgi:predicted membrane channel-forming protein YqfA (hemolysin III family)